MVVDSMQILSPLGAQSIADRDGPDDARVEQSKRPVIGLLNNSKPNVDIFVAALKPVVLSAFKGHETLEITKPRSAGPCPEIDALARRCSFVINAVAD